MIKKIISEKMHMLGLEFSPNESESWHKSLPIMANVLDDEEIDKENRIEKMKKIIKEKRILVDN